MVQAQGAERKIAKVVQGQKMMEGAGVRICRTVGTSGLRNLDPFLMLDELRMPAHEASAGFPDHPHRGMETVSIMLEGKMDHADSCGNKGTIGPGGVQYMSAGRGIVHSEMPIVTSGDLWGFQLWVNKPAKNKMDKPRYQDYQADSIQTVEGDNLKVRVLVGDYKGVQGPVAITNPCLILDVQVQPGGNFSAPIDPSFNGFAYICDGSGTVGGTKGRREQNLVLGAGDLVTATTTDPAGLRFLLVAGKPIGEPIVQHGPFVMNTQEEIEEAFNDFRRGKLQNQDDDVWAP
jgi:redox-sensitive bicupin YhaK (pirin superfamily)